MLIQALSMLTFLAGIFAGEIITTPLLGKPKNYILDIIIFVLIVSYLFDSVAFVKIDIIYYLTNIFLGILTVLILRIIEFFLGMTKKP